MEIGDRVLTAFPETLGVCLLQALKLGSLEARQRFPRLLEIVELHPHARASFVNKVVLQLICFKTHTWSPDRDS